MNRRIVSGLLLTLLLIGVVPLVFDVQPVRAEPRTWTVDDDEPADFSSIQEAINAANSGDTIFVHSGTYYENVIVNKTVSLVGENRSTTVIDAKGKGTVITLTADRVSIKNFTIQNSEFRVNRFGILVSKSKNSIISGNTIKKNSFGIYFSISNNNTINHNIVIDNGVGIELLLSSNNFVNGNIITSNYVGISLSESGGNVLRNNSMVGNLYNFGVGGDVLYHFVNNIDTSNTVNGKAIYYLINKQNLVINHTAYLNAGYLAVINSTNIKVQDFCFFNNFQGVLLAFTNNSKIENVNVSDNLHGIMLFGSNNTLKRNKLTKNAYAINSHGHNNLYVENVIADNNDGIWLLGSRNSISRNTITNNHYRGIYLIGSNNTVFQNEIMNNSVGIVIDFYDNKIHHNNFISNVKQADLNTPRAIGIWDDGYPSGGNYWSNYTDVDVYSGPYQNETGSDGIWDHPYVIDADNQDNYPFVRPWGSTIGHIYSLVGDVKSMGLQERVEERLVGLLYDAVEFLDEDREVPTIRTMFRFMVRVRIYRWFGLVTQEQASHLITSAMEIIYLIRTEATLKRPAEPHEQSVYRSK